MTEMGLQYNFHNMNTGTTAEPTLPTASFSFHIKKSDDQSITLSHCQGFLSHNIFSPYYGVLSREFLNSSLLETSECQNSYSTWNHLLFSFQSFHQSFCLCTKIKKKGFIYFRSRQGCLLCLIKVTHRKQAAGENPAAGEYWCSAEETHLFITVKWVNVSVKLFPLNMGIVLRHKM